MEPGQQATPNDADCQVNTTDVEVIAALGGEESMAAVGGDGTQTAVTVKLMVADVAVKPAALVATTYQLYVPTAKPDVYDSVPPDTGVVAFPLM